MVPQSLQILRRRRAVRVRNQPCVARRGGRELRLDSHDALEQKGLGRLGFLMPGVRSSRMARGWPSRIRSSRLGSVRRGCSLEACDGSSTASDQSAWRDSDRPRRVASGDGVGSGTDPGQSLDRRCLPTRSPSSALRSLSCPPNRSGGQRVSSATLLRRQRADRGFLQQHSVDSRADPGVLCGGGIVWANSPTRLEFIQSTAGRTALPGMLSR